MQTRSLITALRLLTSGLCLLTSGLLAQQVAQPEVAQLAATGTLATTGTTTIPVVTKPATATSGTAPVTTTNGEEVVQMDVFTVNAENDEGYTATNAASGSRVNTELRDIPASITVFTQEFLDDVGAQSIEDLLSYGGNTEADLGDDGNGFNDTGSRMAGGETTFRNRGLAAGVSLDYADTGMPVDLYNIDRAELSSGPNSILFGMGNQGGLLSLTSKRANLQRNTTNITNTLRTWGSPFNAWNYWRATLDYNVVLMPRTLAFRLTGVIQDGGDASYMGYMNNRVKRINPLITIKPWRDTTISMGYETGRTKQSRYRWWNAADGLTAWLDAGRPLMDGFGNAAAADIGNATYTRANGTTYDIPIVVPIQANNNGGTNNNDHYVLVSNDGTIYNFRNAFESNNKLPANAGSRDSRRLPASIASYDNNIFGPSAYLEQRYERWNINIGQNIGANLHLQLAYNHSKYEGISHAPNVDDSQLFGDPNTLISPAEWVDNNVANSLVNNPWQGRLYMENVWMENTNRSTNDAVHLNAETSFRLRNIGRFRVNGSLEYTHQELHQNTKREILVDQYQQAIKNPSNPIGVQNRLFRRQYVTEGDFSTYYTGDWTVPLAEELQINDKIYHTAYVANNANSPVHALRSIYSAAATLQSWLFNDRLVTTIGLRGDTATYQREKPVQVTDPADPRILEKTVVWNEWDLEGIWRKQKHYNPYTFSIGSVWRVTDRISLFANYSTNRSAPNPALTTLPDGDIPDPAKGRTLDYGVMFQLAPKINLRVTHFDTRRIGGATITPNGSATDSSDVLGSTNLNNIFDALYFLTVTDQNGRSPDPVNGHPELGWVAGTGPMLNPDGTVMRDPQGGVKGWGPMPQSMYAVNPNDPRRPNTYPYGAPPSYNAGTANALAQGYEAQLTANITRNFTMIFNFSYTDRYRDSIFPEIFAYYNKMVPIFYDLANSYNPNSSDGIYYMDGVRRVNGTLVNASGNAVSSYTTLSDYITQQLYTDNGSIRTGLNNQLGLQSGAIGSRPFKFNVTARYTFPQRSYLKGVYVGGGFRYQSYNLHPAARAVINYEVTPDGTVYLPNLGLDPGAYGDSRRMSKGDDWKNASFFCGYRRKLWGGRATGIIRLNIDNLFNSSRIVEGAVNDLGYPTRVYRYAPRRIQVTTSLDF